MYKVKVAIIGIVCVLLSLCVQQASYAQGDPANLKSLEQNLSEDATQVNKTISYYNLIKENMEALISDWSASETRVDSNWKSALRTGTIAIVAAATVYATGGVAGHTPLLYGLVI